jgi:hypothetical protein
MWDLLFWLYLANAVFLMNHEIDSGYQKEWELVGLPGGAAGFLGFHFVLLPPFLWGLVLVYMERTGGLILSAILAAAGIFALAIHTYFIKKGKPGFTAPISQFILWGGAVISVAQGLVTLYLALK